MPDFATFKRWVTSDWRAHQDWRKDARGDFAFVAGDQWTDDEKQALDDLNRVPIVFNRAATIINAVAGSEINNRTEVKYFPRTLGDAEVNEVLTKGAEWFRDQSDAEEEDSQAFRDALVCGIGWTETLLSFEEDSEGEPKMQRINPLEMVWDASAERRGLTDAHRFARVRKISVEEAKELFPEKDVHTLDAEWIGKIADGLEQDQPHKQWSDDDYKHQDDDIEAEEEAAVTIVQLQYRQRVKEVDYIDPISGKRARTAKKRFTEMLEALRGMGYEPKIKKRDVYRNEWRQVFLGNEIIEENQPCEDWATFCPITGYWDNAERRWYGLLRQIRDPQKWANKFFSTIQHIISTNAKGGVIVEHDAVDDHARFEEDYAAADSVIWARSGANSAGKIFPKPGVQVPPALFNMLEFAITSIRDVSGVNQELLGLRDQNQPGVLEYQRKQAAMTTLAVLFDALRFYRKRQGEVMLYYMREYLNDGRLVRIADEDGERYEPLKLDPSVRKYDVIVDDAPSSPNEKDRAWEVIMQMMPLLQNAGLPVEVWLEILEYSPLPPSLVQKLREMGEKLQAQPDPKAEAMFKAQLQQAMAEVDKTKAETLGKRAGALGDIAGAQKDAVDARNASLDPAMQFMDALRGQGQDAAQQQQFASQQQLEREKMGAQQMSELQKLGSQERMAQQRSTQTG